MNRISQFVLADIFKSRIIPLYTFLLAVICWSTFLLEDNPAKGILTLLNIVLLVAPLVSILFSTIYIYNSSEFIELLLSQPVPRKKIWLSLFAGVSLSLALSIFLAAGIPLLLFAGTNLALMMLAMAILITIVFVSIAFLCAVHSRDKAKGIGLSIIVWLYLALIFDVLVLFMLFQFSDYPIEKFAVFLTSTNPIDLARILILLQLDVSAMMGYTGAIFSSYYGSDRGLAIVFLLLLLWIVVPLLVSLKKFQRKDL